MAMRIAIAGAAGRTGRRIVALAAEDAAFEVAAALEAPGRPAVGRDAGGLAGVTGLTLPIADRLSAPFDVLIDFSLPEGTLRWLDVCLREQRPMVIGTTGHDETALRRIREASRQTPVLMAPNMSVGVNVLLRIARQLGAMLDAAYDVEIVEAHHRFKVDAPSGTALALCAAVQEGRRSAGSPEPQVVHGRCGPTGQRPTEQIGMHSLRIGDTVGEHSVQFGTLGETISLSHAAHSRDAFAAGALRAARWIVGKPPGLYDMQDVLFGKSGGNGLQAAEADRACPRP